MAKSRSNPVPQHGQAAAAEARAHRLYMEGLTLHHQGQLEQAAAAYEQVLRLVPRHVEALHHVGIIAFQEGNYELAAGFIRSALAQNGDMPGAWCDLGNALKELGRFADALDCYERAIALQPDDADAHYNLGVTLQAMGRHEDAAASYARALERNPDDPQANNNLGVVQKELKQYAAALLSCERAIELFPDYQEAHNNRGNVLREMGDFAAAVMAFDRALALNPRFADAHCNRGIALQGLQRAQDALDSYERALRINPDLAEAYLNRAIALHGLKRFDEALEDAQRAIKLRPDYAEAYAWLAEILQAMNQHEAAVKGYEVALRLGRPTAELHERHSAALKEIRRFGDALAAIDHALALKDYATGHVNRGNVLLDMDRLEDALAAYERGAVLMPDHATAHNNRGLVLGEMGRDEEALAAYETALGHDPEFGLAHWNRALFHLTAGNLREGLRGYEWRWKTPTLGVYKEKRDFAQPLWLGQEDLAGKTILLYAEQGLGDSLQMIRYVERVAALGARIVLELQPALVRLLGGLPGVAEIITKDDPQPAFDFQCPLMSLPLAFGTELDSIPAPQRYLVSDAARVAEWEATLGPKTGLRIGLVWSGSTIHKGDHRRSLALADFAALLPEGADLVSLQKEVRAADQPVLDAMPQLRHFGPQLGDMADTAALCELMDVVVAVDTSVAHLAAALGKPVWLLLPVNADWRWLRDGATSPWYPSMRLYRQQVQGDWAPVLAAIKSDLARLGS